MNQMAAPRREDAEQVHRPQVIPGDDRTVEWLQVAVGLGLLLVGGVLVTSATLVLLGGLGVLAAAGALALGGL